MSKKEFHINTVITSFALQPIMKDSQESIESIEKLGFLLLDQANNFKIKKQSGALLTIVSIVSMAFDIDALLDESMVRISRHTSKEVRGFVTKNFDTINEILKNLQIRNKDNDEFYVKFIMPFLISLGIENIDHAINIPTQGTDKK